MLFVIIYCQCFIIIIIIIKRQRAEATNMS